ncbi:MAG TPA: restriction endonuclease subunit S [Candidatus Contendobacter sp.]|nr:restriction endonuclease subunit S [Candidatus Contendobacter sp.]HRZ22636.1 restriction endonuclease subunit S [Candidatus Contendobacter sp.]
MKHLSVRPIRDYCLGIYDGPHATPKDSDDGPIFLGIKNITEDGRLDFSEIRHVSENEFSKWTRRVSPQPGDVVFTYEATLHRYAIIPDGFRGCLGRRVALIRPDSSLTDSRYLLYFFLSHGWRKVVEGNVISGATVDRIPLERFPSFPAAIPSLPVQREVASILSTYDDLIENNRRRMALLEESARLLYREWFVRLRFPGHEHVRIIDGVPEGWERKNIGSVAEINRQSLTAAHDGEIEYVDISSVTPNHITETTTYNFRNAPSRARRIVRHGDIIWSCVRPNRRSHAVIWQPLSNLIASTGFAVITPTELPTSYLYQATTTDTFVGYLENHARGAAYPAVVAGDFERAEIFVPSRILVASFDELAQPLLAQIHNLRQQNQRLRAARDLLLPRLMSGEIAV